MPFTNQLKSLVLRGVIASIHGLQMLFKYIGLLLIVLTLPIRIVVKAVFAPLVLWVYKQYVILATHLKRSPFMQNKVLFLFGNRYFIHVIVSVITLFVAGMNILQPARANTDTFAEGSGLYAIVNPGGELGEDTVEEGLIINTNKNYYDTTGTMVASIPQLDPNAAPLGTAAVQVAQNNELERGVVSVSTSAIETDNGNRADFTVYTVKEDDTASSIAERFDITTNSFLWANGLSSSSAIEPGDKYVVPPISGYTVEVQSGDTIQGLVTKHKGDLAATIEAAGGEIIAVGTKIVIADGEPYVAPKPVAPTTSYIARSSSTPATPTTQQASAPAQVTGGTLNWPVGCRRTPTTYWGHGLARDISCPSGTPIYAMHSGVATIPCSGGFCGGYGNYVRVSGEGYQTLYAHMSAFNISSGQYVERGQVIGFVGSTGRSTGPHVHIEIWANGVKQEPLNYLR